MTDQEELDLELKKIQLLRERLALEDELRKRQRRAAVHDGVVRAAEGLGRKVGQWQADRQYRAFEKEQAQQLRLAQAEQARKQREAQEAEVQRVLKEEYGQSPGGAGVFFYWICLAAFVIVMGAIMLSK